MSNTKLKAIKNNLSLIVKKLKESVQSNSDTRQDKYSRDMCYVCLHDAPQTINSLMSFTVRNTPVNRLVRDYCNSMVGEYSNEPIKGQSNPFRTMTAAKLPITGAIGLANVKFTVTCESESRKYGKLTCNGKPFSGMTPRELKDSGIVEVYDDFQHDEETQFEKHYRLLSEVVNEIRDALSPLKVNFTTGIASIIKKHKKTLLDIRKSAANEQLKETANLVIKIC